MTALHAQRFEKSALGTVSADLTVTANASANTKGTYTELIASTAFATIGVLITIKRLSSTLADCLVDIAVGAAGSEVVLVPNILFSSKSGLFPCGIFFVPLSVPAGTRVSARIQATTGSTTLTVGIHMIGGEGLPTVQRCENWGAATADSGGVAVNPGAVADTKGVYSELIAASAFAVSWIVVCIGNLINGTETTANYQLDIAIGAAAAEQVLVPNLHFIVDAAFDFGFPQFFALPCSIPAGTRVAARSQSSTTDATDRVKDVSVLAFG